MHFSHGHCYLTFCKLQPSRIQGRKSHLLETSPCLSFSEQVQRVLRLLATFEIGKISVLMTSLPKMGTLMPICPTLTAFWNAFAATGLSVKRVQPLPSGNSQQRLKITTTLPEIRVLVDGTYIGSS